MTRFTIITAALTLSACANQPITLCTGAELRRTGYTATIAVADAWTVSGRPVPSEVMLARVGAVAALSLLNARCPGTPSSTATQSASDGRSTLPVPQ